MFIHTVVFSPLCSQRGRGYAMHLELLSDELHFAPECRASLRLHTAGWQSSWLARGTALWLLSKCVLCLRNSDDMTLHVPHSTVMPYKMISHNVWPSSCIVHETSNLSAV